LNGKRLNRQITGKSRQLNHGAPIYNRLDEKSSGRVWQIPNPKSSNIISRLKIDAPVGHTFSKQRRANRKVHPAPHLLGVSIHGGIRREKTLVIRRRQPVITPANGIFVVKTTWGRKMASKPACDTGLFPKTAP
jgi:hypothetical protein